MPYSKEEGLEQVRKLIYECKNDEALELILIIEKRGNLSPENSLNCRILKERLIDDLNTPREILKIKDRTYQESLDKGTPVQIFDALKSKLDTLWGLGNFSEYIENSNMIEKIYKSLSGLSSEDQDLREVEIYNNRAGVSELRGILNKLKNT